MKYKHPYQTRHFLVILAFVCAAVPALAAPVDAKPYDRTIDVPYGEAQGETLHMDIFVPTGENRHAFYQPTDGGHGIGLIDVISGSWNGSRARMKEHELAQVFGILTARGYTVFAVRVGSLPKFTGFEMVDNLKHAIRWVKAHAGDYGIDPDRIGMLGASAGGHLACMAALTPEPAEADANTPLKRYSTEVAAAGVFFPPTDFLHWKERKQADVSEKPHLIFSDGYEGKSPEEIRAGMRRISPVYYVDSGAPPFLLIHGDEDPIVPLHQSEILLEALREAGNEADLIVKEGGGHFWLTLPEEAIKMADWFDTQLN